MNKKNKVIVLLFFLFSNIVLIRNLKAEIFNCDLIYFKTNKSNYYFDEFIEINGLWDLNYNINQELACIQVQIYDKSACLLFNSSKFYEIGLNTKNWTIEIQKLNYIFTNASYTLFINAYIYHEFLNGGDSEITLLKSIMVNIVKRNISCEIDGYKNFIKYGEKLYLTAQFSSLDKDLVLSNHTVEFKILARKIVIIKRSYITNFSGKISLLISSVDHLNLGLNFLIFNLSGSDFFKEGIFTYEIYVGKYQIFAEIISFKDKIQPNDDITLQLLYYYYNNTIYPLINATINVAIYNNKILKFEENFRTNNSGLLQVHIIHEIIELKEIQNIILLKVFFNGSQFLQNLSLSFNLEIIDENQLNFFLIEITSGSLIFGLFIGVLIFIHKKRKAKSQTLKDMSFKF